MSKILDNQVMVVGLGYVGLPTAAVIADNSFKVVGYDTNELTVNKINKGEVHIAEEGLESLVKKVVSLNALRATTVPEQADIFLITVPTPITPEKKADISYVESCVRAIAPILKSGDLVILESTSPVGTTHSICELIQLLRPDLKCPSKTHQFSDINIAYSPERILPGQTIKELISNSRVVGGISESCTQKASSFYRCYVKGEILKTNALTAEMCKLAENSYRDLNLAFANELSMICDEADISVRDVIKCSNYHPRVNILTPGCGVGGHCIPIDPWFLIEGFENSTDLIKTARNVNLKKTDWICKKIKEKMEFLTKNKLNSNICILGLSYKKDSDDLRESPAMQIAKILSQDTNEKISVVEPHVTNLDKNIDGLILSSLEDALDKCNLIVKLVDHSCFREIKKHIDKSRHLYVNFSNT